MISAASFGLSLACTITTATAVEAAPEAVLINNGDGSVTVGVGRQIYSLRPAYPVIDTPAARATDPYSYEGGMIYFRNGDQSAQGFRLQ